MGPYTPADDRVWHNIPYWNGARCKSPQLHKMVCTDIVLDRPESMACSPPNLWNSHVGRGICAWPSA